MLKRLFLIALLPLTATAGIAELRQQYNQPVPKWPAVQQASDIRHQELTALPAITPPQTAKEQLIYQLGEKLFNDPILSEDRTISCASCHDAKLLFADGRRHAIGVHQQEGNRNTPAIFNLALWDSFFWDGRATTALEQATQPIENPIEMNLPVTEAVQRLNDNTEYRQLFKQAFAQPDINQQQLATALVAFQMQIAAPRTVYDNFLDAAYSKTTDNNKQDITAVLTDQQLHGLHLFRTKANCISCHNGPLLSDNQFHVTGLHFFGRRFQDLGRYDITGDPADAGKFRTPSLRAVIHTGPWMHNGLFTQFEGIVAFYNAGGARPKPRKGDENNPLFPQISPLLKPLALTKEEQQALVEFLKIL